MISEFFGLFKAVLSLITYSCEIIASSNRRMDNNDDKSKKKPEADFASSETTTSQVSPSGDGGLQSDYLETDRIDVPGGLLQQQGLDPSAIPYSQSAPPYSQNFPSYVADSLTTRVGSSQAGLFFASPLF